LRERVRERGALIELHPPPHPLPSREGGF